MKKLLLILTVLLALASYVKAQTTTYLDFEGTAPVYGAFGGSSFAIVDNPNKAGVNTSDFVATTNKAEVAETWGGAYFPIGGTINFTGSDQAFSIDVYSDVAGVALFKVEHGAQGPLEIPLDYTTPGEWQTLTYDFADRDPDYAQIVIFMGFNSLATDVWYYDNVKGPGFTTGDPVDVTFNITDQGGTATSVAVELSNNPGVKIALEGSTGVGSVWTKTLTGVTGSTITAPVTYSVYVNGAAVAELTKQSFTMAGTLDPIIAKSYGITPSGVNVLTNGGFDDIEGFLVGRTANEWGMWTQNGSTAEVIDGVVNVTTVMDEVNNWSMQVEQYNFILENDKTYTLSFDAWADAERIISPTIEDPANGYAQLGITEDPDGTEDDNGDLRSKWDIQITTEMQTYRRVLTVDQVLENTIFKFAFLLAQSTDMVYIDNVSIIEGNGTKVIENKSNSIKIYPNPAVNQLNLSMSSPNAKIAIYNSLGSKIDEVLVKGTQVTIDISSYAKGIYFIKVNNDTIRKFVK